MPALIPPHGTGSPPVSAMRLRTYLPPLLFRWSVQKNASGLSGHLSFSARRAASLPSCTGQPTIRRKGRLSSSIRFFCRTTGTTQTFSCPAGRTYYKYFQSWPLIKAMPSRPKRQTEKADKELCAGRHQAGRRTAKHIAGRGSRAARPAPPKTQYLTGLASRNIINISATLNTMASSNSRRSRPVRRLIFSRRYTRVLRCTNSLREVSDTFRLFSKNR